jgi:hypothetical protein
MSSVKNIKNQTKVTAKVTNVTQGTKTTGKKIKTVEKTPKELKRVNTSEEKTKKTIDDLLTMTLDDEMSDSEGTEVNLVDEDITENSNKELAKMILKMEELTKENAKMREIERENKILKKTLADKDSFYNEVEFKVRDKDLSMESALLKGNTEMSQLMLEMEKSRDMFDVMRTEYLRTKSFLVQRAWDKLLIKSSRDGKRPEEINHISRVHATGTCVCRYCFENKMIKMETNTHLTKIDLSMFNMGDLTMEMETSGMRVDFDVEGAALGACNSTIQITDCRYKRKPLKISIGSMFKKNMDGKFNPDKGETLLPVRIRYIGYDSTVSMRVFLCVKMVRDWMVTINNYNLEDEDLEENRVMDLPNNDQENCFMLFYQVSTGTIFDMESFMKNRLVTKVSDLTMEEEVVLMNSLWGKKVYVKFRADNKNHLSNHISEKPFEGSISMEAYNLMNPFYRNINFYSSEERMHEDYIDEFFHYDDSDELGVAMEEEFDMLQQENDLDRISLLSLEDSTSTIQNSDKEADSKENETNDYKVDNVSCALEEAREERKRILEEIQEIEELDKVVGTMKDKYNNTLTDTFVRSFKTLIGTKKDMEDMSVRWAGKTVPGEQMKSMMRNNLSTKGVNLYSLPILIENKMMYELFSIRRENYPMNCVELLSMPFDEFILLAFMWDNMNDFIKTVMFKDLVMLVSARDKLPDFVNMLLEKKIIMEPLDCSLAKSMDRLAETLRTSSFVHNNQNMLRSAYMMMQQRLYMGLNLMAKTHDVTSMWNSSSWQDVNNNNMINLSYDANVNSWYNMFHNRMVDHKVKFINAAVISAKFRVRSDVSGAIKNKYMMSFNQNEEDKLITGMFLIYNIISVWSASVVMNSWLNLSTSN